MPLPTVPTASRCASPPARFWWPQEPSPTRCSRAKIPTTSSSTASGSRPSMKKATHQAGTRVETQDAASAHVAASGWPRDQLLRRSASVLRRQRRQSHGQRQTGTSRRHADTLRRPPAGPSAETLLDTLTEELRASVKEVVRLTPNIVEVVVQAPRPPARSSRDNFIACRISNRSRRDEIESGGESIGQPNVSPWKASRSPAHRSIAKKVCCPPSCSKWAARPISARSSRPASP